MSIAKGDETLGVSRCSIKMLPHRSFDAVGCHLEIHMGALIFLADEHLTRAKQLSGVLQISDRHRISVMHFCTLHFVQFGFWFWRVIYENMDNLLSVLYH